MSYRAKVYDIDGDYYAIPDDFKNFDDKGDLILERDEEGDIVIPDEFVALDSTDFEDAERELAVRLHDGIFDGYTVVDVTNNRVYVGRRSWLVLTDDEAEREFDDAVENYIDDVLDCPERLRPYIDHQKFKEDLRIDGRELLLSNFDGREHEEEIDNTTYYLYRQS